MCKVEIYQYSQFCCNITCIPKKHYHTMCGVIKIGLVSVPGSWHRAPKTLGISWVIGVSFIIHNKPLSITPEFMLMRQLRRGPLESLRMGLVTRKTKWLEVWNFERPGWWTRKRAETLMCLERAGKLHDPNPYTLPYALFPFGCFWVVPFIINQ